MTWEGEELFSDNSSSFIAKFTDSDEDEIFLIQGEGSIKSKFPEVDNTTHTYYIGGDFEK